MLELRRLHLLRELAVRGTINAVAEALAYTPSAVSQQLAVLEREAGVALLERAGRGVRLTDAGELLAVRADALLAAAEAAEAELAAAAGTVAANVRIAGFQTALLALVLPACAAVTDAHPGVRVALAEAEVADALLALRLGALDLVVGDEYDGLPMPAPDGVERVALLREQVRVVMRADHPLARGRRVTLAGLRGATWAAGQPGTNHREVSLRTCRAAGFEPDLRHSSNDLLVLLAFVRSTNAVALLPDLVGATADPSVAVRTPAGARIGRTIWALTRQGAARRPALAAILAALAQAARATGHAPGLE